MQYVAYFRFYGLPSYFILLVTFKLGWITVRAFGPCTNTRLASQLIENKDSSIGVVVIQVNRVWHRCIAVTMVLLQPSRCIRLPH